METTVNERIKELIDKLNLNPNSFAKRLGVAGTVVYNIIDGRKNNPSYDVMTNICKSFNVNPAWLLDGKGDIFITNEIAKEVNPDIEFLKKQLDMSNKNVEFLQGIISSKFFQDLPVNFPMESSKDGQVIAMYPDTTFQKSATK
jgi:transcriptional regulator with XRE-family HTH domain